MTEKYALLFYTIKIVSFSASTWISHIAAYHILEGLRLRLTDRFLKAPLGDVEGHSIGEIKSIMVEKIENMEPPIAHMIPEGSGHILLPVISFIALLTLDWRIARTSLVTVPLSLVFMTLTMIISGKSFTQYEAYDYLGSGSRLYDRQRFRHNGRLPLCKYASFRKMPDSTRLH